jgi:hypothetical protein
MGGGATGGQQLNPDAPAFDMDAMAAAAVAAASAWPLHPATFLDIAILEAEVPSSGNKFLKQIPRLAWTTWWRHRYFMTRLSLQVFYL